MSGVPSWTFTIDESGEPGGYVHILTATRPGGQGTTIVITDSVAGFTWTSDPAGPQDFTSTVLYVMISPSTPLQSGDEFSIYTDASSTDIAGYTNKNLVWAVSQGGGSAPPPAYVTLTYPVYNPNTVAVNSMVCFVAGTPVNTDQGLVPIEQIDYRFHTINNEPIVAITQTRSTENQLIYIPKNALGPEQPSQDTISSLSHKVLYNRVMTRAVNLPGVKMIPYEGQILYNVLMNNYSKMTVNNLTVETLDPRNDVAIIYKHIVTNNLSELEKDNLIQIYNERMDLQNQIKKEYVSSIVYTIMLKILTDSSV
jgi:hypothetical protein